MVKPSIQFIPSRDEHTIHDVKLTKSRDRDNGQAIFSFDQPSIFDSYDEVGDITGFFMIDEERTLQSVETGASQKAAAAGMIINLQALWEVINITIDDIHSRDFIAISKIRGRLGGFETFEKWVSRAYAGHSYVCLRDPQGKLWRFCLLPLPRLDYVLSANAVDAQIKEEIKDLFAAQQSGTILLEVGMVYVV
ncbi:photosystem II reaction center PSB28 protein, chloroplastic [Tanacetum coccineum]